MNSAHSLSAPSDNIESLPGRKPIFHFWRCFWLTFLVVSLAYAWYSFYVPANEITWADSYASARQHADRSGKRMILYFTGTWCVPCRIMKRQVWADEQVRAVVNSQFVPVAIDVDDSKNAGVLTHYKIGGPPVTIVCDAQGNALDWRTGGLSKTEFLELLQSSSRSSVNDL